MPQEPWRSFNPLCLAQPTNLIRTGHEDGISRMIFSTPIFIFAFLPLFLATYYLTPIRQRSLTLLIFSYAFYGWWKASFLVLIFAMSLVSYVCAHYALKAQTPGGRKTALTIGVTSDLAILGYFKYANFFRDNVNVVLDSVNAAPWEFSDILLPIGISFHTFQSISYIIDVYRKDAPPARTLVDFLAFGSLFPQLIAGPVLRYKDVSEQFQNRTHSFELFSKGMQRFTLGLAMKVLLADSIATFVDPIFALQSPSFLEAWLGAIGYSLQLFFDFAGYSAMAIGLGLMIGFRFMENFNAPYTSRSITEFWQRWHISLSSWLRDYLYISLGGNRRGNFRTYINLLTTMVLGGLWHGANWTFLVWGAWHGGILALERMAGAKRGGSPYPALIAWPLTMILVMIGWVMFRAESVGDAFVIYGAMIGLNAFAISDTMLWQIDILALVAFAIGLMVVVAPKFAPMVSPIQQRFSNLGPLPALGYAALILITCIKLIGQANSPFLYFQF